MRKRWVSVVLCVFILAGVCTVVLAAGGADDSLLSVAWLHDTLLPELQKLLDMEPSGVKELGEEYEARLNRISFAEEREFDYAEQLEPLALQDGDAVVLDAYGRFLMTDGRAKLRSRGCVVVDLKNGRTCEDGEWLEPKHRYFAAEGSGAVILLYSDTQGYVDGFYREDSRAFPAADLFTDIEGHWAAEDIGRMTVLGVVNGIGKHTFAPDMKVSRAMFVTVLGRLFGAEAGETYEPSFTDVRDGDWYAPYINWAAENGLVEGYGNGSFGPDNDITREQMAAVLARCCQQFGFQLPENGTVSGFSDEEKISAWAQEAVELARRSGLLNGRTDGEFDPYGSASRAEMCTVFCRLTDRTD